jgi:hypothetical protein
LEVLCISLEALLNLVLSGAIFSMRRVLILILFVAAALPMRAAKKITIQQLEQQLNAIHSKSDGDIAAKLSDLELTEKLSAAKEVELEKSLPGPRAKNALLVMADISSFLRPPAAELPADAPPPDAESQKKMLDEAVAYAGQALAKLPNFSATKETTLFMDAPLKQGVSTAPDDQEMQYAAMTSATVLYRDRKQVVEMEPGANGKKTEEAQTGLVTSGDFGPILETLLTDARAGEVTWSRWEQQRGVKVAVFHYKVAKQQSHYEAEFCCVAINSGKKVFKQLSGYHGEITLDPDQGTILRMTMQADLKPPYPMSRADLMVEYAPIEIGGQTYICPSKSVAIARGYHATLVGQGTRPPIGGPMSRGADDPTEAGGEVLQSMLNDVTFRQYHLFRSDVRILSGDQPAPDASRPGAAPRRIAA